METLTKQRGVALPIALIMLVMMLITGIYLMRASNNATIMAGNLAYERDISRQADFGLSTAYDWLNATASNPLTKGNLDNDQVANGYLSIYRTTDSYRDTAFWNGSITVTDPSGNPVQYVIHRMCSLPNAAYNAANQNCVQTSATVAAGAGGAAAGVSLSSDAEAFLMLPQIHYVITARVPGVKGASVVNQMVVMIGA